MDEKALRTLIEEVRTGIVSPDDAARRLSRLPFADLGFARVDHHRMLRQRLPEAVYAPGKTPAQCAEIVEELLAADSSPVLMTRATDAQIDACCERNADAVVTGPTVAWRHAPTRNETVLVVTAGTSDLPVASECVATLEALGLRPRVVADCGVAGVHRLLAEVDDLLAVDGVVVVAGMEGALASMVGGMVAAPVVAVPTSTGYGAAFEGITALLAMLATCAPGVAVVGIDNGFGAACAIARAVMSR